MRENDTINVLSLFFFFSPSADYSSSYQYNLACIDLMDAFYSTTPSSGIETAPTVNNDSEDESSSPSLHFHSSSSLPSSDLDDLPGLRALEFFVGFHDFPNCPNFDESDDSSDE